MAIRSLDISMVFVELWLRRVFWGVLRITCYSKGSSFCNKYYYTVIFIHTETWKTIFVFTCRSKLCVRNMGILFSITMLWNNIVQPHFPKLIKTHISSPCLCRRVKVLTYRYKMLRNCTLHVSASIKKIIVAIRCVQRLGLHLYKHANISILLWDKISKEWSYILSYL